MSSVGGCLTRIHVVFKTKFIYKKAKLKNKVPPRTTEYHRQQIQTYMTSWFNKSDDYKSSVKKFV